MKPHILIVDDSITVRMDLKDAFEGAGFVTTLCSTLESAREACQTGGFDLAILDVMLPDGDGIDFLRELKATPATAQLPVLLLSTEGEVRDRMRGLKTGADDYVGKPYNTAQMIGRAHELMSQRQLQPRMRPLILVVDDSPTFIGAIRDELEEAGYDVAEAASAEEGLRQISDQPDAVIIDQIMPGMDGIELVRQLRADSALRRLPCLLLTASEQREDELRALEAGADAFTQKQAGIPVVLAKLSALLRKSGDAPHASGMPRLMAPKRILVVDGDTASLGRLCDDLRDAGYDAVSAHSTEDCLEYIGAQPVDCILLDLHTPGDISGVDLCRQAKDKPAWRNIPLIALAADREDRAFIEAINAGADDFIPKSEELDVLMARLHAQMRRKQFEDEKRELREQQHRREKAAIELQGLRELVATRDALVTRLERKNAELQRTNEELRRAKEAVDAANRELESFSYSVSHDLRAPLRVICRFTEMLIERTAAKLTEEELDYQRRVIGATQHMQQLIEDMLTLSRLTRQELRRTRVDLSALAREVITQLQVGSSTERVAHVAIKEGMTAKGDPGMMRILLENLLGNAWKFTAQHPQPRIEFACEEKSDSSTVFYVRDNGVGFDMKYAEKLFGVFQRLHSDREFQGAGVGLATVMRVVRRHGGKIWAEGKVDEGAVFYFTLGDG